MYGVFSYRSRRINYDPIFVEQLMTLELNQVFVNDEYREQLMFFYENFDRRYILVVPDGNPVINVLLVMNFDETLSKESQIGMAELNVRNTVCRHGYTTTLIREALEKVLGNAKTESEFLKTIDNYRRLLEKSEQEYIIAREEKRIPDLSNFNC